MTTTRMRTTASASSRRSFLGMLAGLSFAARRGAAATPSRGTGFRDLKKAMWVWKVDAEHLDAIGAFAKDAGIDTALLSLPALMRTDLTSGNATSALPLRALRQSGLSLVPLTGDPSWVQSPGRMPQSLGRILKAAADNEGLFDGISLDVEPNALPAWHDPTRRKELMDNTLAFYDMVRAGTGRMPIDAALNPAFAELRLSDGQNFLEALARRLDSISIMAYRDNPEATIKRAAPAIALIEHTGVPWRLGVLVHASSEKGTSFVKSDRAPFEADMIALDDMARHSGPSAHYRGLIFEDYHGLATILRS